MVHQGIAAEVSKAGTAVHKITSTLVLVRVTGPNTAVFFICLNASALTAKIKLRVELEAANSCFVQRESGSEVALVPPGSSRIILILRPKKLSGRGSPHKFSYSWESLGEGAADPGKSFSFLFFALASDLFLAFSFSQHAQTSRLPPTSSLLCLWSCE